MTHASMMGSDGAVAIPVTGGQLPGELILPERATGVVTFAHGSGSSRLSPRNQAVAEALHEAGLGTLLFDLLTPAEAVDRTRVFDIPLLGQRLVTAVDWLESQPVAGSLPLGLFGASTGSAAALYAAAHRPEAVRAVVSRGGRPDLAAEWLDQVHAPTLLIVGGRDEPVLGLNQAALRALHCPKRMMVVPGATHLFEEPGALERVCRLAREWFVYHLQPRGTA